VCQYRLHHCWRWHPKCRRLGLCNRCRKIYQVLFACRAKETQGACERYRTLLGDFPAGIIVHQEDVCLEFLNQHDRLMFPCPESQQLSGNRLLGLPNLAPWR
jgi:hypothetical protein